MRRRSPGPTSPSSRSPCAPTGFYRNKARAVRDACQALVDRFGGSVPANINDLVTLPGVARKTANVVLNNAFQIASGVIVDTHVARVSPRLGLTDETKPERIEADLMKLVPRDDWIPFGAEVVLHGRYVCTARDPHCARCILDDLCPKRGVTLVEDEQARSRPTAFASESIDDEFEEEGAVRREPSQRGGSARSFIDPPLFQEEVNTMSSTGAFAGIGHLPEDWCAILADELDKPYFHRLQEFVAAERRAHAVFPPEPDVFNALRLTPYERTNVLLLGQDPYHDDGQAHGLCFSVQPGVKPPPSLVNMFKELRDDLGCTIPKHGYLASWAEQGVLLLNAVLTVRRSRAELAQGQGLGDVHRRHHPSGQRQAEPGRVRAFGRLCPEEGQVDRRLAARDPDGGAPLALVGQEILRQPAVLGDQRRPPLVR